MSNNSARYGSDQRNVKTEIIEAPDKKQQIQDIKDKCQKAVRATICGRRQQVVDMLNAHTHASIMNHGPVDGHGKHRLYSVSPKLEEDISWHKVHLSKDDVDRLIDKKVQRFYLHADATDAERAEREEMLEALVYDENSPLNP